MYGSIESANIVGYMQTELPSTGLSVGASFVPVAGEAIDLCDISVTGYKTESYADVQIQTLTGSGATDRTFEWYEYGEGEEKVCGWFEYVDEDYVQLEKGDVLLTPGEGLWSVTMAEGLSLQSAGQVPTFDIAIKLPSTGLTLANPSPVVVDLTACYVSGYKDETYADVQVQTLTGSGATDRTFEWYEYGEGEDYVCGWFEYVDEDYVPLENGDVTIAPGAGVWSVTMAEGLSFVWPKVNVK